MSEAEGGAPHWETLFQQISNLTQAMARLQENQLQTDGRLTALSATVTAQSAALAAGQPAAPPPVLPASAPGPFSLPPPEPRVPLPERFSGDRKKFRSFKGACELYLSLQPRTFGSGALRVKFIASLLLEEPQAWAHALLATNGPEVATLDAFFTAMAHLYDDPLRVGSAESALQHLRQGRRPVEEYAAEFRRWAGDTEWNDAALRHQFRTGLSESLKDELARSSPPTTLNGLVLLATQLDRRLRERRAEKSWSLGPTWMTPRAPLPRAPLSSPPGPSAEDEPEPMQLGLVRPPVSPEEQLRRRQRNLCFYCGKTGHFIRECPVRPGKPKPLQYPHLSVSNLSPTHLAVSLSLQVDGRDTQLRAIIDSGACSCFLDLETADRLKIPRIRRSTPLRVQLADGSTPCSGPVSWETPFIPTTINDHHQEALRFDLLTSPLFPVILGLPWLQAHNPHINWGTRQLLFSSTYCQTHCLLPASPGEAIVNSIVTKDPDLQHIPPVYHQFRDVFDKKGADHLPPHRSYDCPIELLPGAKIPYGRIFPLTEPELETLRTYLDDNLKKGFIRPSSSPAGAGIFFVEKKDHSLRPCVDYRELNGITIKNRYPLPLVPELFQRLRSAKVFTKIDLRGAYNLVRVREGDEWKTAFRTRFGHYEYLVMPFGLCNAPATFQHFINDILHEFLDVFVMAYLDDILIFSDSLEEHRMHVATVLTTLRKHQLYAKSEKCQFEVQTIQFLGLIISTKGLMMDPEKISAILQWPSPTDRKGVQRFVGFANFYRRFIRGFSAVIAPITNLTRINIRFSWTTEAEEAFRKLKGLFTSAPLLQHPDPRQPYTLEVDASETALGAVLSQRQGPKSLLHPVAFFSRKLSAPERNYDVGDRELLAIKVALEEWRYLLEGAIHPIVVFTDHRNLEYLRTAKRLRPRQARWALFFSRFSLVITYRPGSKNGKADALSRMFPETEETPAPDTILSPQSFLLLQEDFRAALKHAVISEDTVRMHQLQASQGLWWAQGRIFVPNPLRIKALELCHDSRLAGHFGEQKTLALLRRNFWWPNLAKDCGLYVSSCPTCARNKTDRAGTWGLLRPLPVPERPWESVSMDFVVELPPSEGFSTILVVVDRFTKMVHFLPMKGTPSAEETAQEFIKGVVRLHGLPKSLISDRGTQFTSKFWRALCRVLGVDCRLSSAYHPQTNGQTERANQSLEQYLRCFSSSSQDDWAPLLPLAEFAFNNAIHASTRQSPFWANYGFHPTFLPVTIPETPVPAVQERVNTLQQNYKILKETIHKAQERFKATADKRRRGDPKLGPGDKVWLATRNLKMNCPTRKLGPKFIGPFRIKRMINPVAFELELPDNLKVHPVFHSSLLKPAKPDPFPGRPSAPPPPVEVDGDLEFEVEKILDGRRCRGRVQYLVAWKGYGPEENSWEPASHLHAPELLEDFFTLHPEKASALGIRRLPLGGGHCHTAPSLRGRHGSNRTSRVWPQARARARARRGPAPLRVVTSPRPS